VSFSGAFSRTNKDNKLKLFAIGGAEDVELEIVEPDEYRSWKAGSNFFGRDEIQHSAYALMECR